MPQFEPDHLLEGLYEVDIVGESFYPESFTALPQGDCFAILRHDSSNPYDCNSVGVFIESRQVGRLPRDMAEMLCSHVARRTNTHGECVVKAEIAGGTGSKVQPEGDPASPRSFLTIIDVVDMAQRLRS